jgi:hypothetical protein
MEMSVGGCVTPSLQTVVHNNLNFLPYTYEKVPPAWKRCDRSCDAIRIEIMLESDEIS